LLLKENAKILFDGDDDSTAQFLIVKISKQNDVFTKGQMTAINYSK
jgi:hypothetical protein